MARTVRRGRARRGARRLRKVAPGRYRPLPRGSRGPSMRAMNMAARRQINRMVETQDANDRTTDVLIGSMTSTAWTAGDQIWCLTPNTTSNKGIVIAPGTGEADRKGNKVRTAACRIRITGIMEAYNATSNPTPRPQIVRWFVITAKKGVDFDDVGNVIDIRNDLYEDGNNTQIAGGNIFDTMLAINTDKYNIHAAGQFKIYWAEYTGTGGSGATNGNNTNNDFKYFFQKNFNFTKYCPKVIQYMDNSSGKPTSKAVWFCMYTVPADGGTPGPAVTPIRVKIIQEFKFKDL